MFLLFRKSKKFAAVFSTMLLLATPATQVSARNAGLRIEPANGPITAYKSGGFPAGKEPQNKFRFYLPKQWLDLTLTFSVYADEKKDSANAVSENNSTPGDPKPGRHARRFETTGDKPAPSVQNSSVGTAGTTSVGLASTKIAIEQPAKIAFVSVPDPDLAFVANYQNMRGLLTDIKSSDLNINESGCLTGMNAEFVDQTAQIAGDALATAFNIAKKAAPMFATTYTAPTFTIDIHRIVRLETNFNGYQPAQNDGHASDFELLPQVMKTRGVHFDLEDAKYGINNELARTIQSKGYNTPLNYPKISVWLDNEVISATSADLLKNHSNSYAGIVIRDPNITEMVVYSKQADYPDLVLADTATRLAQTGSFVYVPMQRRFFSDFNAKISCGDSGSVQEVNQTNTSVLKTIFDALKMASDSL